MPIPRRYTTDAIVLSRFDLGEADRVLTLITPAGGKLKAIAKGIRKPTSRLGGSLEPFAELTVALARGRTFDVVTQVSVGHAWLNLRDDLESAATAWYLAELADRILESDERFRWVPPLGGIVCERCPGPPHDRTGLSLEALKVLKAYQRLDIEALAGLRLLVDVEREAETALRDFVRHVLEREARSLAFLDEVRATT
jgi:recombinational DNA repair protein (RecF pathway)